MFIYSYLIFLKKLVFYMDSGSFCVWELVFSLFHQCQYIQYGKDRGDGAFTPRGPGREAEAPRVSGSRAKSNQNLLCMWMCVMEVIYTVWPVQEREMEMRRQALEDERRRREALEKRLQEETSRRQRLVEREVKLREKQRSQVFTITRRGSNLMGFYITISFM